MTRGMKLAFVLFFVLAAWYGIVAVEQLLEGKAEQKYGGPVHLWREAHADPIGELIDKAEGLNGRLMDCGDDWVCLNEEMVRSGHVWTKRGWQNAGAHKTTD